MKEKIKWYQEQAKRTCPSLGSDKLDLAHMVLGIFSENEELLKAYVKNDNVNIQEEIADQFWYLANYCTLRNLDLSDIYENKCDMNLEPWEEECELYTVHLSKLQDYIKKYIAYNKEINKEKELNSLKVILWDLDLLISQDELDLEQALQNNIDKLKVRFPDKFTENLAKNRNLEAERKELEK